VFGRTIIPSEISKGMRERSEARKIERSFTNRVRNLTYYREGDGTLPGRGEWRREMRGGVQRGSA